ncbi:succinate dehydrogenase [Gordonibacter sp. 28C]|uniref:FAD-binding protein n=1 Tax=Gordonibacter sp. 28C TaxID=2078569 RepID=UPI000DF85DF4|nr:FAD-binding protein [Gordonibacter sp. 28C]RDB64698.1 succinate dehydrogenase [Gordonibacter sp. 28C]
MKEEKNSLEHGGIGRRDFLKGALGMGAVAATAALVPGCSPQSSKEAQGSEGSGSASASQEGTGYVATADWLGEKPEIDDGDIVETVECDVVVCGGGHAGIQAALAAAEGGAKVAVIEQSPEASRKVKGEDVGHVNSQFLIDRGFGPYDEGEVVQEFCTRAAGRVNTEVIRKYVANSGETFDHMVELVKWPDDRIKKVSQDQSDLSPLDDSQICIQQPSLRFDGPVEYPLKRGGFKTWPSVVQFMGTINHETFEGNAAFSRLDEVQQFSILEGKDLGVEWHCEQKATVLTQDDDGAVTGVIAEGSDGYVKYVASKGVILCTGDFAANTDMTWNLLTEYREWNERAGMGADSLMGQTDCYGEGHKMGCWAGGMIEAGPRGAMSFGGGGSGPWGTSPFLWLNSEGDRFMNEAATSTAIAEVIRQPRGGITGVTDANWRETLKYSSLDHGCANFGREDYYTEMEADMEAIAVDDPKGGTVRMCTVAERMACQLYKASTLDGLADMLGYTGETKENFLASIERYNELCHAGADTDFGKDACLMTPIEEAPFYGYGNAAPGGFGGNNGTMSISLVTLCGLVTNGDLQVLDKDANVIPGLYAAGNTLGGRYGLGYSTPITGNSIGMAVTHGRVAGKLITGQEVR